VEQVLYDEREAARPREAALATASARLEAVTAQLAAVQGRLAEREALVDAIRREAGKKVTVVHHLETALSSALSTRKTEAAQVGLARSKSLLNCKRPFEIKKVTVVHHLETALSSALSTRKTEIPIEIPVEFEGPFRNRLQLDSTLGTLSAEAEAKKEVEHQLLAVSGYVQEQDNAIGELRMEAAAKAGVETALAVVRAPACGC
jgi:hypothetical protein